MYKKNIENGKLYPYYELLEQGYQFVRIKVNRELDSKEVRKKVVSIKDLGGVLMPISVVPAETVLKEGLEVVTDDGIEVSSTTKDLDKILVVIDGQHRIAALKELYSESKSTFSASVMLPLISGIKIVKLLQEANTSVNPWDGIDWLTSLYVTAQGLNIPISAIEFVKELSADPNISDSAAWLWARNGIVSKAQIVREIKKNDPNEISNISETKFIQERRDLFRISKEKLGEKLVGLKKIPQLLMSYEEKLVDDGISRPETWKKVINFIDSLDSSTINNLKGAKKTETQTKDQQITKLMNAAWKKYVTTIKLPDAK